MDSVAAVARIANNRGKFVLLAILAALFVALYWPTFGFMAFRWGEDTPFPHGWLVIPIALGITWQKREKLKRLPISSHPLGVWLIGLALLLHVAEKALDLIGPSPVSLPFFVAGAVLYFAGPAIFRELAFPIAFLFFMVPVPGEINTKFSYLLRRAIVAASAAIAGVFGVEVQSDATRLQFGQPNGVDWVDFEVLDTASNLSALAALLALHALVACYTPLLRLRGKWTLFLCSLPVPVLANILRVTLIILTGAYASKMTALLLFSNASAFLLLAFDLALLFLLAGTLRRFAAFRGREDSPVVSAGAANA